MVLYLVADVTVVLIHWSERLMTGLTVCSWEPAWPLRPLPTKRVLLVFFVAILSVRFFSKCDLRLFAAFPPYRRNHKKGTREIHLFFFSILVLNCATAMGVFCGGNQAEYWAHWEKIGAQLSKPPKFFLTNFFQQDESGKFLWPGFGDNSRILKWVIDRINGVAGAPKQTAIGLVPHPSQINTIGRALLKKELLNLQFTGMDISAATMEKLLSVDVTHWRREILDVHKFIEGFGAAAPKFILDHVSTIEQRLDIGHNTPATTNKKLLQWVAHWASVFEPESIFWVDGTEQGK